MRVLGIDIESTGLDPGKSEIIELSAVLWEWERGRPLKIFSELVHTKTEISADITLLTGIENGDIEQFGKPIGECLGQLKLMSQAAEYIVAHNGSQFDQLFLSRAWQSFPETEMNLPWIDTLRDLPFPNHMGTRKLSYLAAEHGFLNPFSHRSLFDTLTMLRILSKYPIQETLQLQSSPWRRLVAKVGFEDRGLAKDQGFRWDAENKQWYLDGKECQLKEREFPFKTVWL
jgi:DNA polymerase III subunit epsilon